MDSNFSGTLKGFDVLEISSGSGGRGRQIEHQFVLRPQTLMQYEATRRLYGGGAYLPFCIDAAKVVMASSSICTEMQGV